MTSRPRIGIAALLALVAVVSGCDRDDARDDRTSPRPQLDTGPALDHGLDWTRATVGSVTDGDTLRLEDGTRIRLLQIDTPEVGDREQCWGEDAADALEDRLPRGTSVGLAADPSLDDADDHGRLLRYVSLDGEVLNSWLVREGHALPYFFRGERGAYAQELLTFAREARDERRGMWGACRDIELNPGIGL